MKTENRTTYKIVKTAAALAVTVGVVLLMRAGAGKIAAAGDVDSSFRQAEAPLEPAEKIYDLGLDVPADLSLNVCGMDVRVRRERLPMPVELAEQVTRERALAAGWESLDEPLASVTAFAHPGETLWRRPDGAVVARRLTPLMGDMTELAEYDVPLEQLPKTMPQSAEDALFSAAAASGHLLRARLPGYVTEVVGGGIYSTQKVERNGSCSLYVYSVSSGIEASERTAFASRASNAGWRIEPRQEGMATKANLNVQLTVRPFGANGTLMTVYRFADDENYIQKGKREQ